MPATHALGDTCASACERQGTDTIGAEVDAWVGIRERALRSKHILQAVGASAKDMAVRKQLQGRDLDANINFVLNEFPHGRPDPTCTLKHNQSARLSDLKVDVLSIWWVCRICRQIMRSKRVDE